MSTLIAAYLFFRQGHALPVVITKAASSSDPSWVSSSNVRGTYDLILGCLATLLLSSWTAWHPNFHPGNGPFRAILRRLLWIVAIMAAPEIILFSAWEQRCTARKLQEEVNRLDQRAYDAEDVDSAVRSYEQHLHNKKLSVSEPAYIPRRLSAPSTTAASLERDLLPFRNDLFQNDAGQPSPSIYSSSDTHSDTMVSSQSIHSRTSSRRSSESRAKPFFPPWTLEQSFFAASGGITVDTSTFWPHPTLTFTPAGVLELAKAGLLPSLPLSEVKDKSKTDVIATILVSIQSIWFIAQCLARLARHLPLTLLEIHTLVQLLCILAITIIWAKKPYNPVARALSPTTHERLLDMAALFAIDPHLLPTTLNPHKNRLVYPVDITEATQAYTTAASAATTTDRKPALPFTPASPEIDHSKIAALHTRASRALDHLRRRHRAAVISSPVGQSPPPPSLTYTCPHVVRAHSDVRVEGPPVAAASPSLWAVALPAAVAALYGGVLLGVSWVGGVFPTGVERGVWRGAGALVLGVAVVGGGVVRSRGGKTGWARVVLRAVAWGGVVPVVVLAKGFVLVEVFASLRAVPVGTYEGVGGVGMVPHVGW